MNAAGGALAQDGVPLIREIAFSGNDVTQPTTMLREMTIHVGDPADPVAIERSRQGVQDLGLFRAVSVRQERVADGVRVVFVVKEKFYVLPLPRLDASSDGGYAYGAQLRWNNVWGLNHTFTPYFERRQPSEGDADPEKRGIQTRGQIRYSAPFIFESPYSAGLAMAYFKTPFLAPVQYETTQSVVSLGLSRKLSEGEGSQGWTASSGLTWEDESNAGLLAPPEKGRAVSLSAGARYRDLHFNVYSDEGMVYGVGVASATEAVLSDYHFSSWGMNYARYLPVGSAPHQNLNLLLNVGARHDGGAAGGAFVIGGVESIRGFEPETAKGDAFYVMSIEYLRPVFRNSVRALVVVDAANAFPAPADINLDRAYVSAGLGLRVRFQAFVNLDLEIGVAWPADGGPPRLFASKV